MQTDRLSDGFKIDCEAHGSQVAERLPQEDLDNEILVCPICLHELTLKHMKGEDITNHRVAIYALPTKDQLN